MFPINMHRIEVIGNLAADAQIQNSNGTKFLTFRVAHSEKITKDGQQQEITQWYSCSSNMVDSKIVQYLKKGQKVYVRGVPAYTMYDSAVHRCKMIDVRIFVRQIELVGASPKQEEQQATGQAPQPTERPFPEVGKEHAAQDKSDAPF